MRNQDPMLTKLYETIRSLRQAQRQTLHMTHRALQTFRTFDEAEEALDAMACDGLVKAYSRHRVVRGASGFSIEPKFHNQ
jgi:hypothetical protein